MRDIYNRRNSIQWIQQEDIEYPEKLRPYKGMPKTLYVLGGLPDPSRPSVAVVGARRSTSYGDNIARQFSAELAANGIQIISGLAWGIDTAAHTGALEGGGETYAVMGCGVDVCYPAGNRKLYDWILQEKRGGIISEQEPGRPPLAGFFPARNRIISGLADLVLVVEAREKSGSLITADQALEQAGVTRKDIDAVACTYAPGLIGAVLVGVNFAKSAAYGLGVPLIPVHHVRGHIAANYITHPDLEPPFLCLCVSGGNTLIVDVQDYTK